MKDQTRRRLFIFGPLVAALVFLLWPLASRRWDIPKPETNEKDTVLSTQQQVRASAPRIIIILADDLGTTDIGLYGGTKVATPNIDSIGRDGVTFTDATCTTAICAPSRAALLTGRYQQRFGFELQPHDRYARNRLEYLAFRYFIDTSPMVPIAPAPIPRRSAQHDQGIPDSELLLPELLQSRGYSTAVFGKWHLGYSSQFSPLERGFETHYGFYEAFSLYGDPDDPEMVNAPIDDFSDGHMWNQGRDGASAIVRDDQIVDEEEYLTFRFADLAAQFIQEHNKEPFFLYLPFSAPHTPLQAPRRFYDRLDSIPNHVHRTYAAMIAALDEAVGTILDAVDTAGIAESTLIAFASDNGGVTYLGVTDNGPYAGGKFSTFQGGLSVPLMMRYPAAIPAGIEFDHPVSLLDVFSTVAAVAGGSPEGIEIDGVNLLPHVSGAAHEPPHDSLFWHSGYNSAVRKGPWKLIVQEQGSPDAQDADIEVLFNLESDPYEKRDLAAEHPEIVRDLREDLARWRSGLSPPLWPPVMHFWIDVWGRRYWFAI